MISYPLIFGSKVMTMLDRDARNDEGERICTFTTKHATETT
jgi:hypothetical protein